MLDKVKGYFERNKTRKVILDPPWRVFLPAIPGRSELLGAMEAWTCPSCGRNNIYMFSSLDSDNLIVRCGDCDLEIRHEDREVIGRPWRGHDIGNCPNCNLPFSQHNLACPEDNRQESEELA